VDKIFVVERGKVIEHGTHDELLSGPTYYRKLVEKQEGISENTSGTCTPSSYSSVDLGKLDYSEPQDRIPLIAFEHVTFAYPTRPHKKVMDDFNLSIYRGQTIGLVGPSGGGKSTVAALIERFYDPNGGAVKFQGCDIKHLNCSWYRDQIGFVGQEPTLFNETIARNIAYGAPCSTQSDIEEACKQAFAHDFIMGFSEKYNTFVGERGTQLSGGQKQRVAIGMCHYFLLSIFT
jgi:ABC-type multidrug transport system fused ATPase/permease subunit